MNGFFSGLSLGFSLILAIFIECLRKQPKEKDGEALKEVSRLQRRPIAKTLDWYEQNEAAPKVAMAYLSGDYTMKEIAEWFGVHYSTVSRAVRVHEKGG